MLHNIAQMHLLQVCNIWALVYGRRVYNCLLVHDNGRNLLLQDARFVLLACNLR